MSHLADRTHRLNLTIAVLASFLAIAPTAAFGQSPISNWVPNGPVRTMVKSGLNVYVGGKFSQVGPPVGNAASIDAATGLVSPAWGRVSGTVHAVEPDGSGGWYVGGQFTTLYNQPIVNLGHIVSEGSLASWFPTINGTVYDIAVLNGIVYVGGTFTQANGTTRNNLAAFDATTGALQAWNPSPDGPVTEVEASTNSIFVGGTFHNIAGQHRDCMAEITTSGSATLFFSGTSPIVDCTAMEISNGILYVAATIDFSGIIQYGTNAYHLGPGSGPPTVVTDAPVRDIVADNSSGDFYLGGDFLTVSSVGRSHVARVNGATGALTSWAPSVAGNVLTLDLGAGGLVVGGNFASVNGTTRNNIASIDLVTGSLLSWDPNASGQVNAVASDGGWIHAGGSFPIMNGVARSNLFAMELQNQTILPWNPGTNDTVLAICASTDTIYIGGRFSQLAGTGRSCLGAVHRDTGALYPFNPNVTFPFTGTPYVAAIVKSRNWVYFGGQFTHVGGLIRSSLAAVDVTTNALAPWNPDCNLGAVWAMGVAEPPAPTPVHVVIGGSFSFVGGGLRNNIASLSGLTGAVEAFNPDAGGPVFCLLVEPSPTGDIQEVIFGGAFTALGFGGFTPAPRIARWPDMFTTVPAPNGLVRTLQRDRSMLYIGGDFTSVAGVARNRVARLSLSGTALALTLYDPSVTNGTVNALEIYDNFVYAGGSFLNVKGVPQPYFAGIYQNLTAVETSSPPAVGVMPVIASPNPFGEKTAIRFTLDAPAPTRILLIDAHGRVVRRLHDGFLPAGRHAIAWNGRDDGERAVGSGVYFAEVLAGSRRSVSKVFHLK